MSETTYAVLRVLTIEKDGFATDGAAHEWAGARWGIGSYAVITSEEAEDPGYLRS